MNIWQKSFCIIGAAALIVAGSLYLAQGATVSHSFASLEQQHARHEMQRALGVIAQEIRHLDLLAYDWAAWDDTYQFVADRNEEYIKSNLPDKTFLDAQLNLILISDASGRVLFSKGFDLSAAQPLSIPEFCAANLDPASPLLHHAEATSSQTGLVLLSSGPMLIASRPIITSEGEGPIRGALLMGRFLDQAMVRRLSETAQLPLRFERLDAAHLPADFQLARSHLSVEQPLWVQPLSEESLAGYALLTDLSGQPALILRLDLPRDIYRQGQATFNRLAVMTILSGLLFFATTFPLFRVQLLSRVKSVCSQVKKVAESGNLAARLSLPGSDELAELASDINDMLATIQRSAEALRQSENMYRSVFETTGLATIIIEEDTTISLANKECKRLLGWSKGEIEGKSWTAFVAPEDLERLKEYHRLRRIDPQAAPRNYECRLIDREGRVKDVYLTAAMIPGTGKSIASILDVTAQKQHEQQLRQLKEFNESIVQSVTEGLLLEDSDGIIIFVNPALEKLLGYRAEELVGSHWRKIVPAEELELVQAKTAQRPAGISEQYEARLLSKDGRRVPVLVSARPLFEKGLFKGVLSVFTDISTLKQAEEERQKVEAQLRQAQKLEAVALLAGGVAHEFNNLLLIIQGNTELAMDTLEPSHPLTKRLTMVQKAAERGTALVKQMLAFSRHQLLQAQLLDVNKVVGNLAEMLAHMLEANIQVQLELAPQLKPVLADASALEQVVMNLVLNARDAMPQGGTLRLETAQVKVDEEHCRTHSEARPGEYVRLSVVDNGVGMDETVQKHLFEPFFTTKEVGKGSGLGLSVVYGIVKQHEGFIECFSQPKQGTRFDIYLPVREA